VHISRYFLDNGRVWLTICYREDSKPASGWSSWRASPIWVSRQIWHLNLSCCRNQKRACGFTEWFDYITSVLVELSNAEEFKCKYVSRSRHIDSQGFHEDEGYLARTGDIMAASLTSGEIFRLTITAVCRHTARTPKYYSSIATFSDLRFWT
jgi:hypothetical protein